jgi:membrane fusion protein, multidrug efflux system
VKLGSMAGPDFIIEDGLHEGDRVIVDGVQKVRPGMFVKTVSAQPPAGGASGAEQPADAAHGEDSTTGHHGQGE